MRQTGRRDARVLAIGAAIVLGLAGVGGAAARGPGVGVGAPGPGTRDPGLNQPGQAGNVGVGAPGVDPGLNQPGLVGNVGGVARRSVRR